MAERPPPRTSRGGHPIVAGFVLIAGITVLILVLAVASTLGFG
jgi:hypothetical protein